VNWTDSGGGGHSTAGRCLPNTQVTKGVRFAVAVLPTGMRLRRDRVWVDCRNR